MGVCLIVPARAIRLIIEAGGNIEQRFFAGINVNPWCCGGSHEILNIEHHPVLKVKNLICNRLRRICPASRQDPTKNILSIKVMKGYLSPAL